MYEVNCVSQSTLCTPSFHPCSMICNESPGVSVPVFSLRVWGTQFWVWIQNMLHFLGSFIIHLFSLCLCFVCLHWGEVIVPLPFGFQAQLVPIVLDVRLLLQGFIYLGRERQSQAHTQTISQDFPLSIMILGRTILGFP